MSRTRIERAWGRPPIMTDSSIMTDSCQSRSQARCRDARALFDAVLASPAMSNRALFCISGSISMAAPARPRHESCCPRNTFMSVSTWLLTPSLEEGLSRPLRASVASTVRVSRTRRNFCNFFSSCCSARRRSSCEETLQAHFLSVPALAFRTQ